MATRYGEVLDGDLFGKASGCAAVNIAINYESRAVSTNSPRMRQDGAPRRKTNRHQPEFPGKSSHCGKSPPSPHSPEFGNAGCPPFANFGGVRIAILRVDLLRRRQVKPRQRSLRSTGAGLMMVCSDCNGQGVREPGAANEEVP